MAKRKDASGRYFSYEVLRSRGNDKFSSQSVVYPSPEILDVGDRVLLKSDTPSGETGEPLDDLVMWIVEDVVQEEVSEGTFEDKFLLKSTQTYGEPSPGGHRRMVWVYRKDMVDKIYSILKAKAG